MAYAIQHRRSGDYICKTPLGQIDYLPADQVGKALTFRRKLDADRYRVKYFGSSNTEVATVRLGGEPATILAAG